MDRDPRRAPPEVGSAVDSALWTVKEVAAYLNVKESTIRHWVHTDYIPRVKFRGAVRFRQTDIVEWLNRCSTIGRTDPGRIASRILRDRR